MSGQGTEGSGKRAKEREKVLLEAAEWLAKAIDNRMSTDEKARFEAWLENDTEHREAYQQDPTDLAGLRRNPRDQETARTT